MKTPKNRVHSSNKRVCNKSQKRLALCITHVRVRGVSEKNQNDRLEILKARYEQEIRDAEENIRSLKAKLATINTLEQESEKLANPEAEPDKYAGLGFTISVYDAVKSLWDARKVGATTIEIKNYLLAHGFQPAENFDTAIYTVLKRLCESDKGIIAYDGPKPSVRIAGSRIRIPARKIYKPK